MLLYSEHSHKTCSTDSHSGTLTKKALVPHLDAVFMNKSLEPMSETPCKPVLLALKIFLISLYTLAQFTLLTHSRIDATYL